MTTLRTMLGNAVRRFFRASQATVRYVMDGAGRNFKDTQDDYPKTGVQPFEGEISKS